MSWRPLLGVLVMAAGLLGFRQLPVWVAIPAGAILYGAVALPGGGHRVLRGLAAPDSRSAS